MSAKLTYRTLTRDDLGQMHTSFVEAFSSYQVNMKMSKEAFEDRMLSKLNINFDLSPGVFSGEKLVGFIFQTINEYEGQLAAYNGGTGVIPGYLGQGLTTKMYDFILPKLKSKEVQKCVLEVLVNNESAIKTYTKAGFKKTKTFQCLMLKSGVLEGNSNYNKVIQEVSDFAINEYGVIGEVNASMLDQLSQVKYHLKKETVLEDRRDNELLGYIIFQPHNGRITQLSVRIESRRQGIGAALVHRAHQLSESKTLSVLNIETKEKGVVQFFEKLGFAPDLEQYEMQRLLTHV